MKQLPIDARVAPTLNFARKASRLIGVDRAILFTVSSRFWQLIATPVTIFMIVKYLTTEEQGFYYTFQSILGLQVLVELGLGGVLMQFVSHEWAGLSFSNDRRIIGDPLCRDRFAGLVRFGARWFAIGAVLVFVLCLSIGSILFGSQPHPQVEWYKPWLLLVMSASLLITVSPYFPVLEGCHKVAEVALVRVVGSVVATIIGWVALYLRLGLYVASLMSLTTLAVYSSFLLHKYRSLFGIAWASKKKPAHVIKWKAEFWPMQWRTAVTWGSSYFLWQLFTPVLFYYRGARAAGQMGISMTIAQGLYTACLAWMTTKAPLFGTLIVERNFRELRRRFTVTTKQSFVLLSVLCLAFFGIIAAMAEISPQFGERFLPPPLFGVLLASFLATHIIGCEAIFLRAFKEEPLVWVVLANSLFVGLCVWLLGQRWGASAMVISLFSINCFVILPWATAIWRRKWMGMSPKVE